MVEKDHKKATRYDYMIAASKIDWLTLRQKRKIMYSIAKSKKTKLDKMSLSDIEFSKNCPNLEESRNTRYIVSISKEKEKLLRKFCSKNNIDIIDYRPYV